MTEIVRLPLPSFLIDPQDGELTPYEARSLVDPSELSDQSDHQILFKPTTTSQSVRVPSLGFSPINSISPITRSRATSDALEKLLSIQAQQLNAIGQAWRARFSFDGLTTCSEKSNEAVGVGGGKDGFIKAERSLRLSTTGSCTASKYEIEGSWLNETHCSVDSISSHGSFLEDIMTDQIKLDQLKSEEQDPLEGQHEITPLTELLLQEWNKSPVHSIINHKTLVLTWLNQTNLDESLNPNEIQMEGF